MLSARPPPLHWNLPPAHECTTTTPDAWAEIRRMAPDEPGPGQRCALKARKHIAIIRRRRPRAKIELRGCPAHSGVPGNEKADEWQSWQQTRR